MMLSFIIEDHGFVSDSEETAIAWVIFDGPLAMSLFSCYHFPRHFSLDRPFPENLYKELLWCLPKSDPASILHASTQIFLLFEYLAGGGIKSLSYSEFSVESAARYIESNLSNPELNVNTICEALHISRASFRKKFMEKNVYHSEKIHSESADCQSAGPPCRNCSFDSGNRPAVRFSGEIFFQPLFQRVSKQHVSKRIQADLQ